MSREPWILPLPETSSITLIWWHVKCTASQNKWCNPSHKPKNIFNWTYFRVLFTVIHSSVLIFLRKSKTDGAIQTNMIFMDPVWDSFPFCMRRLRTVQSQTGTKITRVGSATDTKSDRSEFVFRSVPCKRIKRNVWRAIRTHTGLSSSRSFVISVITHLVFFL